MLASKALASGLEELGLDLPSSAQGLLQDFASLLELWNRTVNLVSRRDMPRLLERHVLDSLSIWPLVEGARGADVGSGGGFPGIPLAIALDSCRWTLIERSARKAGFLREAQRRLALDNVEVVQGDVMDVSAAQFDTVVARAYAPAEIALKAGARLCRPGGVMLLMVGSPGPLPGHSGFDQADSLEVWVPILGRAHGVHRFRKSAS